MRQDAPRVDATLAKAREKSDPDARVCVFVAATPDDRAWADKHLAAHSFPTIIAMPKRGGVYKYGAGAYPGLLGAFDEACRASPRDERGPRPLAVAVGGERGGHVAIVGAVGVEAAGAVGGAAELATPFVLAGAGLALSVTTALKFVNSHSGRETERRARRAPARVRADRRRAS